MDTNLVTLVFEPITSLRVDAVCTRLEAGRAGMLPDWMDASANTQIIEAAGMTYHDRVIHQRFDAQLSPRFFILGDRSRHNGNFNHVIFMVSENQDTHCYINWLGVAENNGCVTVALPLTIGRIPNVWLPGTAPGEWLRNTVLQQTVFAYMAVSQYRTSGMLARVYIAYEPRFCVFEADIRRTWAEEDSRYD